MLKAVPHMVVFRLIPSDEISRICWTFLINLLHAQEVCGPKQGMSLPSRMQQRGPYLRTDSQRTTSRWEPIANITLHRKDLTISRLSFQVAKNVWWCSSKINRCTINKILIQEQTQPTVRKTFLEVRRKISLTNLTTEVLRWATSMIVTFVRWLAAKEVRTVPHRKTEETLCPNQEEIQITMFSIRTIWLLMSRTPHWICTCNNRTGNAIRINNTLIIVMNENREPIKHIRIWVQHLRMVAAVET